MLKLDENLHLIMNRSIFSKEWDTHFVNVLRATKRFKETEGLEL